MFMKFLKHELKNTGHGLKKVGLVLLAFYLMGIKFSLIMTAVLIPIATMFGFISGWWLFLEVVIFAVYFGRKRYKKYSQDHQEEAT